MNFPKTSLIILLSFISLVTLAQQENISFQYYGVANGLLNSEISGLAQDRDGFLWVGGNRGLFRFNGYEFENFNKQISNEARLNIKCLLVDNDGTVWIGTDNTGLYGYSPSKNSIVNYRSNPVDTHSISSNYVTNLFVENENSLWVGHWFGLSHLDPTTGQFTNYPFDTPKSKTIYNYNMIEKIVDDGKGNLWLGTWGGGVHKFNKTTHKFDHFEQVLPNQNDRNLWVKDIVIDQDKIWLATIGDGLVSFDPKTKKSEQYLFFPDNITKGYQRILTAYMRNGSELWLGTEKGLIQFNKNSGAYSLISDSNKKSNPLQDNIVTVVYEDNHKGIWIAAGGLNYYNYSASKFKHIHAENVGISDFDNDVQGFLELSPTEVWVSTSKGIAIYNPKDGNIKMTRIFPGIMHKMSYLKDGTVAAVSLRDGLSIYNPTTKALQNYRYAENDPNKLISEVLIDLKEDTLGNLWISHQNGLSYFKTRSKKFIHIIQNNKYTFGLKNKSVSNIEINAKGELYLVGQRELFKLEWINPKLLADEGPSMILTDTTTYAFSLVKSFHMVRSFVFEGNSIWISGEGITHMDATTKETKCYGMSDGLASDDTRQIITDNNGHVWVASNNGLSYLNTLTGEITNFFKEDGLQGNRFNTFATMKDHLGNIYLGGNNGFNIIDPDGIYLNDYLPPTRLSNLLIYNKPVVVKSALADQVDISEGFKLQRNVSYEKAIKLNYDENVITFEFASLNFLYPHLNSYAYYMEGVDKDWNYVNNRRFASYSNLPEGQWLHFKVKSANNNGIWNTQESTIALYIEPPFWNTLLFRIILALAGVSIVLAIYFLRIRQLKLQRKRLVMQVKERTSEIELQKAEIEVQNNKLYEQSEELKLQNSNIVLLSEMGKKITASIELEKIFERLYQLLNEVMDSPLLAIGEVNSTGTAIDYWEIFKGNITNQSIPTSQLNRLSIYSFRKNQPIFSNNIKEDVKLYIGEPHPAYRSDIMNSAIYIPLHSPTESVIGVLVVKSDKLNAFELKNVTLLKNIATYISIALVNSHTYQKIEEQRKQLQELDRIKTRFYTNISHEFRTPLSLVIGPAEELIKSTNLNVKEREYLHIILNNSKRLLRLVTQIMDLSKLDDGVLRLETSHGDIVPVIRTIADSFSFMADKKNIRYYIISNADHAEGYFDKDKIEKITYNLLNNAFKYTNEGDEIRVTIDLIKKVGINERVSISIEDSGIGISVTEIDNIFQQYYRVSNQHTQTQFGAGIGLSLVKKLVELHHGSLQVKSRENEGSCFTIEIPIHEKYYNSSEKVETFINNPDASLNLAEAEMTEIKSAIMLPSSRHKEKILIVEDNEQLIAFMDDLLREDFEVVKATNGQEAMDIVKKSPPALVMSDVMMPKMNGIELCKRLKADEATRHIPIVLLTAKNAPEDQLVGLETGADEYLAKPLNADLLKLRINNLLATHHSIKTKFENKIIGNIDKLEIADNHKEFMRRVIQVLEENITNKDINIDLFASELGVSRTLLYERIKKATGESLGVFIKTTRLNYAAKLLLEKHYNASELAYHAGFSDPKYFSKCFRSQFGQTPKEFLRSRIEVAVR